MRLWELGSLAFPVIAFLICILWPLSVSLMSLSPQDDKLPVAETVIRASRTFNEKASDYPKLWLGAESKQREI